MQTNTLTKQEIRMIAHEIANGRGTHSEFARAWAQMVIHANETHMQMIYAASKQIIDFYHIEGYVRPLGKQA